MAQRPAASASSIPLPLSRFAPTALAPVAASPPLERLEAQLRELREARDALRAEWAALKAELGVSTLASEAELEARIAALPAPSREELRRYQAETGALVAETRALGASSSATRSLVPSILIRPAAAALGLPQVAPGGAVGLRSSALTGTGAGFAGDAPASRRAQPARLTPENLPAPRHLVRG